VEKIMLRHYELKKLKSSKIKANEKPEHGIMKEPK
jgi:hypothetical protein